MHGSRNFCQGGPGPFDIKVYFYRIKSNGYFKENYHFPRFQRGSNIFQGGGGGFLQGSGGSNCLFPIEAHITCDFPDGVRTPVPPLGPPMKRARQNSYRKQQQYHYKTEM